MKRLRDSSEPRRRRSSGQSMVEFVLVAPILIVLFVAIADFGRIFAAGIVVDNAARNAAETAAQWYLSDPPGDPALTPPQRLAAAPPSGNAPYYENLDQIAAKRACADARSLPSTDYNPSDGRCATWPAIRVCVHDGVDPQCGVPIFGFRPTPPGECTSTNGAMTPAQDNGPQRYVEVRLCQEFTSILTFPLISFGTFYIERTRQFVIPCYLAYPDDGSCG